MFGRKKKTDVDEETTSFLGDENDESVEIDEVEDDLEVTGDEFGDESEGPYDISEIDSDDPTAGRDGQRLDLGSVLVPMPAGGQLQVEMAPNGSPQAVHLVTEHGRITVAAYAAPKSPGQWREVVAELAQSLRDDNSAVSVENGPWGRELAAVTATWTCVHRRRRSPVDGALRGRGSEWIHRRERPSGGNRTGHFA